MGKRSEKPKSILKIARERFVKFIAEQLNEQDSVSKSELADQFIKDEPLLMSKLNAYSNRELLKGWAEVILKGSLAQVERPQMELPMDFSGVFIPAAFSFRTDDGEVRHVPSDKALGWQFRSHLDIEHEHIEAARIIHVKNEALYNACRPLFAANPNLTLREAMTILRNHDSGAA